MPPSSSHHLQKRTSLSSLIFLLAIAGLFIIAFFAFISGENIHQTSRAANRDEIEDSNTFNQNDNSGVRKSQSNFSSSDAVSPSSSSTSSLTKLQKCSPAKHSSISKAALDRNIAGRLENLCSSNCKIGDKKKYPPNVDVEDWKPDFCNRKKSAEDSAIRYDHGCYDGFHDDHGHVETENYNNYNPHEGQDGEKENEGECRHHDSDVTAVFTAISNSSVGARFFGSCQEYAWESIRQWRIFHPHYYCKSSTKISRNKIFMIVSNELFVNPLVQRNASHFGVTLVNFEKELVNDDWRRYENVFYVQGYMHPCGSRKTGNKDFNKLVSARFFAIEALMRKRHLRHIMCLENDMMVYTNFGETIEAVKNCGWRMASMFPHSKGVIPGLMYVRESRDILKLSHFINDLLSCGAGFGKALTKGYANDMTYMLNFYQMYGGQWMGDLPNSNSISGKENCVAAQLPSLIHDGASFGQWYSFALKMEPPVKDLLDSVVPIPGNGDKIAANAQCGQEEVEEDENNNDKNRKKYFKTSGCLSWEKPLEELVRNTKSGAPISTAKPPLHVMNSMKGRFVDATPGELVKWRFDEKGRRVPYWGKYKLSSLHVHAKNLFWFRSK